MDQQAPYGLSTVKRILCHECHQRKDRGMKIKILIRRLNAKGNAMEPTDTLLILTLRLIHTKPIDGALAFMLKSLY
jgi:hypothetical protein